MVDQQPTVPAPMNTLSVVAFVVSLLGFNLIAIILGAIGLGQVKKRGDRGRGFALAAIWIGVISIIILIVVLVIAIARQASVGV